MRFQQVQEQGLESSPQQDLDETPPDCKPEAVRGFGAAGLLLR